MVEYNIDKLLLKAQINTGEPLSISELARQIGVSRPMADSLVKNRDRNELELINRLLKFFQDNGLEDCTVGDLFRTVQE